MEGRFINVLVKGEKEKVAVIHHDFDLIIILYKKIHAPFEEGMCVNDLVHSVAKEDIEGMEWHVEGMEKEEKLLKHQESIVVHVKQGKAGKKRKEISDDGKKRIVICRHGKAGQMDFKELQDDESELRYDVLSDTGKRQSQALAKHLKEEFGEFDQCFRGTFRRHKVLLSKGVVDFVSCFCRVFGGCSQSLSLKLPRRQCKKSWIKVWTLAKQQSLRS